MSEHEAAIETAREVLTNAGHCVDYNEMCATIAVFLKAVTPSEAMDGAGRSVYFVDLDWRCPNGCEPNDPKCDHDLHAQHNHDGAERIWQSMSAQLAREIESTKENENG